MTAAELLADALTRIREVTAEETVKALEGPNPPLMLDVREPNETNLGRVKGSMVIARGQLETKIEAAVQREQRIVVYCASGNRSVWATETLQKLGYQDVASLKGGWKAWIGLGGPVEG